MVQLFLETDANINAENNCRVALNGNPLSAASECRREGIVRLLLENGANINAEPRRVLKATYKNCDMAVMDFLLDYLSYYCREALQGISVDVHEAAKQLELEMEDLLGCLREIGGRSS